MDIYIKEKENDIFWIKICEFIDGSMGQYCDKLIIQFVKRRYLNPEGNKDVVSIEKLGKWDWLSCERGKQKKMPVNVSVLNTTGGE